MLTILMHLEKRELEQSYISNVMGAANALQLVNKHCLMLKFVVKATKKLKNFYSLDLHKNKIFLCIKK